MLFPPLQLFSIRQSLRVKMSRNTKYEPVEYDSDEEVGSGMSGDELETREPLNDENIGDENINGLFDVVKPENFKGVQSIYIDFEINASPEEMASNRVDTVWKMKDHLPKYMKQNLATKNRHLATDADLHGNTHRCAFLELEILQQKNDNPFAMGIKSQHMMNRTLNQHDAFLWTVPPATPTMSVKELAFEPTNPITKNAYLNSKMYTLADLDEDIVLFEKTAKRDGYGTIATRSLAYDHLLENLALGVWREEYPKMNLDAIEDAIANRQNTVEVTYKVASQLKEKLAAPAREINEKTVNLEDFTVDFVRADGQTAFNSPMGLHGELCNSEMDTDNKFRSEKLMQRGMFHVKAKLYYFLMD